MLGKKILAGIFAALTLIKLAFLLISPEQWLGATQAFLGHYPMMVGFYLVLLVITGYFVFTRLDLIDVAVVCCSRPSCWASASSPTWRRCPNYRKPWSASVSPRPGPPGLSGPPWRWQCCIGFLPGKRKNR